MRRMTVIALYFILERQLKWTVNSYEVIEAEQVTLRFCWSRHGHRPRKRILQGMLDGLKEEIQVMCGQTFSYTIDGKQAVLSF